MFSDPVDDEVSPDLLADAVSWRHHLHRYPEIAFKEHQTAEFIATRLSQFGYSVHRGLAGTGVVGTLTRGTSRRTIGIRADMDALPIQECSGVQYESCLTGAMHACGHDGHVAMALAAAGACAKASNTDGTVRFIFQPAEENEGGAKRMIEEGLFRLFPCEVIYALHNWPALPLGTFVALQGAMLAAFGTFEIVVSGRGCHGALPHEGTDCILAGCHLISALQSIVSRSIDPRHAAVISVTQVQGGDTWNVIPNTCTIRGTTRWFEPSTGDALECRMRDLSHSVATAFGCEATLTYMRRYPATINERRATELIRRVASTASINLASVETLPSTGSEDFAYMLQAVPGCYVLLGAGKNTISPNLHSPHYDFNDELLPLGTKLWVSLIREYLRRT